ncbi:MAG: aminotransferase class V-fold PLP-dependent enzyme, partial [Dermabacter sp.]|nr:aminotransferase class V-fold PLP-dependent enzyme [Dermabacter sp.]
MYLDHAATTAIRPSALDAYAQAARTLGNPSSQHASGRRVRGIFDDAVAEIADVLGVPRSWIIMTSGGTEADNLALRGIGGRVVGLATDHPAVVDTVRALGGDLAPVDSDGRLDLAATEQLLAPSKGRDAAALVSAAL